MRTKGMAVVGRGAFSTVYRKSRKVVLIKSRCKAKECMSEGFFPDTFMFPKIKQVGISEDGEYRFYEGRFYKKEKSLKGTLDPFDWEFYNVLRSLRWPQGYSEVLDSFNKIPDKFHKRREHLISALDGLLNFEEDICFEISPRNVAVSKRKLILLDVFFFKHQLWRQR